MITRHRHSPDAIRGDGGATEGEMRMMGFLGSAFLIVAGSGYVTYAALSRGRHSAALEVFFVFGGAALIGGGIAILFTSVAP